MFKSKFKMIGLALSLTLSAFSVNALARVEVDTPTIVTGYDVNISTDMAVLHEAVTVKNSITHEFDVAVEVKDRERIPMVGSVGVGESFYLPALHNANDEVGWRSLHTA